MLRRGLLGQRLGTDFSGHLFLPDPTSSCGVRGKLTEEAQAVASV